MQFTPEQRKAGQEAHRAIQSSMKALPSGDLTTNEVPGRLKLCAWGKGEHTTRNISEICDTCWRKYNV